MSLSPELRSQILDQIKKCVLKHHINVGGIDYGGWARRIADHAPELLTLDIDAFEDGVRKHLLELKSSHTGFYHEQPARLMPQYTVNATLHSAPWQGEQRWMFLDVFEDGPAQKSGIVPGDILLAVDGVDYTLPNMPAFGIGVTHRLTVVPASKSESREIVVTVPHRKGSIARPPIVVPTSISHSMAGPGIGLLKVLFFPGLFGMRFSSALAKSMEDLKRQRLDRLIIDLRGNIGGSMGFAHLASYLCAGRVAIGHSVTPQRLRTGYDINSLARVPIPGNRAQLIGTLGRFAFQDKSIMLLTQGLGSQPFHNRVVILMNEHTNSAAEMVANFAVESRLATTVGVKTPGNVLGASNFRLAGNYWLRIPVFGWYTPQGQSVEGTGVTPDVMIEISTEALGIGIDNQMQKAIELVTAL
ncbi:MAG: S41 family peptidase [Bryobacteraceae bacterium]